jgi:hypothetical protein
LWVIDCDFDCRELLHFSRNTAKHSTISANIGFCTVVGHSDERIKQLFKYSHRAGDWGSHWCSNIRHFWKRGLITGSGPYGGFFNIGWGGRLTTPRIVRWLRPENAKLDKEAGSGSRIPPEQILNYWKGAWQGVSTTLPQEYRIDTRRLSSTAATMILAGMGFIFLEWYFQDYSEFPFGFFLGVFLIGGAIYQLGKLFSGMDIRVQASSEGIRYSSARENWQFNWREIAETWERNRKSRISGVTVQNVHTVKIKTRAGNEFKLDRRLRDFPRLANTIQAAAAVHLLPEVLRGLQGGASIDFIKWAISSSGIQRGDDFLPWEDVRRIIVYNARIQIRSRRKRWLNFAEAWAWDIPNFPLFHTVSQCYTEVSTS